MKRFEVPEGKRVLQTYEDIILDDATPLPVTVKVPINPQPPIIIYSPGYPRLKEGGNYWVFLSEELMSTWDGAVVTYRGIPYPIGTHDEKCIVTKIEPVEEDSKWYWEVQLDKFEAEGHNHV